MKKILFTILILLLVDELNKYQKYKTYVQNNIYKTQHKLERLTANRYSEVKIIPKTLEVSISAENWFVLE